MVNLSTQVRPAAAQMLWVPQKSPAREEKVQTALRLDPARWHPRNGFHSHFLAGAPHLQDPYLPAMAELKLVDSSGDDNPFDAPYLVLLALCLPPPPASGERAAKRPRAVRVLVLLAIRRPVSYTHLTLPTKA